MIIFCIINSCNFLIKYCFRLFYTLCCISVSLIFCSLSTVTPVYIHPTNRHQVRFSDSCMLFFFEGPFYKWPCCVMCAETSPCSCQQKPVWQGYNIVIQIGFSLQGFNPPGLNHMVVNLFQIGRMYASLATITAQAEQVNKSYVIKQSSEVTKWIKKRRKN